MYFYIKYMSVRRAKDFGADFWLREDCGLLLCTSIVAGFCITVAKQRMLNLPDSAATCCDSSM